MIKRIFGALLTIFVVTALSPAYALSDEAKAMLDALKAKSTHNTSALAPTEQAEQTIIKPAAEATSENSLTPPESSEQSTLAAPEDIFKIINSADSRAISKLEKHIKRYPNSVKIKSQNGSTPLHEAAQWSERDIVKLLLRHGADVNAKNNAGFTPLDFARNGNIEILKAAGAKSSVMATSNSNTNVYSGKSSSINSNSSTRPRLSNGNYTIHTGPRGGKYHISASGKKVYHKKR